MGRRLARLKVRRARVISPVRRLVRSMVMAGDSIQW